MVMRWGGAGLSNAHPQSSHFKNTMKKQTNKLREPANIYSKRLDRLDQKLEELGLAINSIAQPQCEIIKIGEIQISSTAIRADNLLGVALSIFRDRTIKKYLGLLEKKKMIGGGIG